MKKMGGNHSYKKISMKTSMNLVITSERLKNILRKSGRPIMIKESIVESIGRLEKRPWSMHQPFTKTIEIFLAQNVEDLIFHKTIRNLEITEVIHYMI